MIFFLLGYDKADKENLLYALGYRQDTEGKGASRDVEMDKPCYCTCGRCLCVLYELPNTGTSGCGTTDYDSLVTKGTKRTTAQVTSILKKVEDYNDGM